MCLVVGARTGMRHAFARKKVIVKRLHSIQNFGRHERAVHRQDRHAHRRPRHPRNLLRRFSKSEKEAVLQDAYLLSHFQTGLKKHPRPRRAQPSRAAWHTLYREVQQGGRNPIRLHAPDDVGRGRGPHGQRELLTKGAPEAVFAKCTHFESDGDIFPMEPILVGDLIEQVNDLSEDGFRVLAVATKKVEKRPPTPKLMKRTWS